MRQLIQGGRLICPAQQLDRIDDLLLIDDKIAAIGPFDTAPVVDKIIHADGLLVIPGLVDLQARLREPGQTHKGTIASETAAAAAAGVTTLCCPPDTQPVIGSPAIVEQIIQRAQQAGHCRVLPIGALTPDLAGERISEMAALKRAGCVALSNARRPITNTLVQRRAYEYAATLDLPLLLHAEEPWLANGSIHEGAVSARLGLAGIPEIAEVMAVSRDLLLIEQSGVRAHFGQLSTIRALDLITEARARGLPVSADIAAHHLFLIDEDVIGFNSHCHVRPPLRGRANLIQLRAALAAGQYAAIVSDHQPHDRDAKLAPFAETEPGISAIETLLPLLLRLVDEEMVSLAAAIALVTCEPAAVSRADSRHPDPRPRRRYHPC
jgi:dihydroorotase